MSKKFKQPKPKMTIKAIDKLIKHYERYAVMDKPPSYQDIHDAEDCPLCKIHITVRGGCCGCPWFNIDDIGCITAGYRSTTTEQRLLRLKRWKKKIQGGM